MSNHAGQPVTIKNAVCIHEEDDGLLWKVRGFRLQESICSYPVLTMHMHICSTPTFDPADALRRSDPANSLSR